MYLRIRNKALEGGALYYVIFVVFVLSAIVSLFIMQRALSSRQIRSEINYFERIDDLNSALVLYLNEPELYQQTNAVIMELFEDSTRQVEIFRHHLGLLDLISARVVYKGKALSKTILGGMDPFGGDSISLYVPDKGQALFASGNTIINGNAVLPVKGIQRASIEGKPLQRSVPVKGMVSVSNATLPALAPWMNLKLNRMLDLDSLLLISGSLQNLLASSIEEPSLEKIRWYGSEDDFQISGLDAKGAVGFISKGAIYIRKDAQLDGSIISASKILVEEGFQGRVQLFARDSLVLGAACKLDFPSVLCVYNNNVNPVFLKLGQSSVVNGYVLVCQPNLSSTKPFIQMERGSLIRGQVYHQGIVELLGSIHGSLYCEGFYRKTKRAFYENHLLDNKIDFYQLPPNFVFIDFLKGFNTQIIDVLQVSIP